MIKEENIREFEFLCIDFINPIKGSSKTGRFLIGARVGPT